VCLWGWSDYKYMTRVEWASSSKQPDLDQHLCAAGRVRVRRRIGLCAAGRVRVRLRVRRRVGSGDRLRARDRLRDRVGVRLRLRERIGVPRTSTCVPG
jgi:hypothetical protein